MDQENMTFIETLWGDKYISVDIKHTEEFLSAAKELSGFIGGLPLTVEQNDKLVYSVLEQVVLAERAAFKQGFACAVEVLKKAADGLVDAEPP